MCGVVWCGGGGVGVCVCVCVNVHNCVRSCKSLNIRKRMRKCVRGSKYIISKVCQVATLLYI